MGEKNKGWAIQECFFCLHSCIKAQLQVSLDQGPYRSLKTVEERNLAAAKSAIFLIAFYLIDLGYFLGLSKSILTPQQVVPYLGFLSDSDLSN